MLAAVLLFHYLCMRVLQSYILGATEWGLNQAVDKSKQQQSCQGNPHMRAESLSLHVAGVRQLFWSDVHSSLTN